MRYGGRPPGVQLFMGKEIMPGKRKPPPLAFTALTCQFAPETRCLPAGKLTPTAKKEETAAPAIFNNACHARMA